MGFKHRQYLTGSKVYSCSVCRTHMATIESMMSRRFNGQHGQAFLFEAVFNIIEGEAEERQMTTGRHLVRDISCAKCGQTMGWKYEKAYEQTQQYKEGMSILEKALLIESTPAMANTIISSTSPHAGEQPIGTPVNVSMINAAHTAATASSAVSASGGAASTAADEGSQYSDRAMSVESEESE